MAIMDKVASASHTASFIGGKITPMAWARTPYSAFRKNLKEMPISAGLMTNGKISSVRASEFSRPVRCSSSAAPSDTASVINTSAVMKTPVTRMASKKSGSSVSRLT